MTTIQSITSFNPIKSYPGDTKPVPKEAQLKAAIFKGSIETVRLLVALDPDIINTAFDDGMLPLHAAVRLKHKSIVQYLLSQGAKVDTKDFQGMSALDYAAASHDAIMVHILLPTANIPSLFAEVAQRDPLRQQKIQILLGLLSIGAIGISSYDETSAALLGGAFTLLNIGSDLAVSYDAYLLLAPETTLAKAAYWATALGSIPVFSLIDRVPGAKMAWDVWRTSAVCRRAVQQINVAYNNYAYDKWRSIGLVGTELLAITTTAYQVKDTFQAFYNNLPYMRWEKPEIIAERFEKIEREQKEFYQQAKHDLEQKQSNLVLQQEELTQHEAELSNKIAALTKKETAFKKLQSDWSDTTKKEPVCKEVYQSQLDAYRERIDKITSHPILPFMLDPAEKMNYKTAFCSMFGDKVQNIESSLSAFPIESRKARYKELALLFHPDKCLPHTCPDFIRAINKMAYQRLITANEYLNENVNGNDARQKVKCHHNTIILQTLPQVCPVDTGTVSSFFKSWGL